MNIDLKEQAHGEIERIFRILLPQNGLAVREEQIALCHAMLDTLLHNKIALCDAGVGIGKTYAYLTACILLKKFYPSGPAGSQPVVRLRCPPRPAAGGRQGEEQKRGTAQSVVLPSKQL